MAEPNDDDDDMEWPEANLLDSGIGKESYNAALWTGEVRSSRLTPGPRWIAREVSLPVQGDVLDAIEERSECSVCRKMRKYYCYTCHVPLEKTKHLIPQLHSLPVAVDIVKHKQELDGKSTAIHAKVICPDFVRVFSFPDIPDYSDEDDAWLLFPGPHSLSLPEAVAAREGRLPRRLVVIDATWKQTSKMCGDQRLARLTRVRLDQHQTAFWRQQVGKPEHYLATIEAIYYFFCDFHRNVQNLKYSGEFDALLFLFTFMHNKLLSQYGTAPSAGSI